MPGTFVSVSPSGCSRRTRQITCDTIVGKRGDIASVPLTEELVTGDLVVLNLEKVGLSEQFIELCSDNRNEAITISLGLSARRDGTGVTFNTGFAGTVDIHALLKWIDLDTRVGRIT